mmetsp:Transcript_42024/g.68173  ORF Transcript_42024/g.68173 Transcript_42024/m.68173 type:complete len:208 (-) Transcript_42024:373-996(-)
MGLGTTATPLALTLAVVVEEEEEDSGLEVSEEKEEEEKTVSRRAPYRALRSTSRIRALALRHSFICRRRSLSSGLRGLEEESCGRETVSFVMQKLWRRASAILRTPSTPTALSWRRSVWRGLWPLCTASANASAPFVLMSFASRARAASLHEPDFRVSAKARAPLSLMLLLRKFSTYSTLLSFNTDANACAPESPIPVDDRSRRVII